MNMAVPPGRTSYDLPFHTCKHCQRIKLMSGEEPVLNFSLEDILIAAEEACKFCQLLLDSENYFTGRHRVGLYDRLSDFENPAEWFLKLNKNGFVGPPDGVMTVFVFTFHKGIAGHGVANSREVYIDENWREKKVFRFSFTSSHHDRLILCAAAG
jgi:hypothetical protein